MNNYFDEIVKEISRSVAIDSSYSQPKVGMPFGEGAAKALESFLSLASSLGFRTKNYDNYIGEVIFGEGEDFAVLAHLDVVPAGNGWKHSPFGGEVDEVNKRIWGRGTMDDTGPAIITLYALKALKDEGFTPGKRIKLIVGCNEESGWGCIEHYNKVAKMPETGISPDADFPVIYAEKGIMQIKLRLPANDKFTSLKGGEAANMVCAYCEVTAPADAQKMTEYGLKQKGGKLYFTGKSAHGSTPDKGINAIAPVLRYLGMDREAQALFEDKLGLKHLQDETGPLTLSPNVITQEDDGIFVTCDVRYPATLKRGVIVEILDKCGYEYEILHEQAPLFNDRNGYLISTLLGVYNEVMGANAQPVAIGGGTYARALKNGAAFGPEEDGDEPTIHQPDEYITFEKIRKCFAIYKLAIERLTR